MTSPELRYRASICTLCVALFQPLSLATVSAQGNASDVDSKMALARQHLSTARLTEAEGELREVLAKDPQAIEAHFLLGYTLFREHRPTESLAAFSAGAKFRVPTAAELVTIASDYILLKDLADAERWLLYGLDRSPSDPTLWYMLGRTQYNQDHNADAARSFVRCLQLHARDIRAEYNLGLAYEKLGRSAEAAEAYRNAIAWQDGVAHPDPQPYLDLGSLLLSQKKPAEALGPLQDAVRLGPHNALAYQQLGLTLEALGRLDEAVSSLQRTAELSPGAEQPHFFLARIFRRLGRPTDAAAQYAIVSKLLGSHSDTATPNKDSSDGEARQP